MAYYSGFQSNAFQNNAFQIKSGVAAPSVILLGGGPGEPVHNPHAFQYRQEYLRQQQASLKRVEQEIEGVEKNLQSQKQPDFSRDIRIQKKAAKKLAALEASLQDDISALRIERMRLIRLIDDEETILVILLSMPFH